jgi:hypothetical protein
LYVIQDGQKNLHLREQKEIEFVAVCSQVLSLIQWVQKGALRPRFALVAIPKTPMLDMQCTL